MVRRAAFSTGIGGDTQIFGGGGADPRQRLVALCRRDRQLGTAPSVGQKRWLGDDGLVASFPWGGPSWSLPFLFENIAPERTGDVLWWDVCRVSGVSR